MTLRAGLIHLAILITLLPAATMVAQTGAEPVRPLDTIWLDVRESVTEIVDVYGRPLRFEAGDWGLALGGAAVMGGTFMLDEELRVDGRSGRADDRHILAEIGYQFGENRTALGISGSLYAYGLIFDNAKVRRSGRHLFQALLYTSLLTEFSKRMTGRARPHVDSGNATFRGPWQSDNDWLSFPSGHTAVSFTIAATLSAEIDRPWASAILYSLAGLGGWSRIYDDAHWSSDVVTSALLSGAIGYALGSGLGERYEDEVGWMLSPSGNGLVLTYQF